MRKSLLLLLSLISTMQLSAQTDTLQSSFVSHYFHTSVNDGVALLKAPASWDKNDLSLALGSVVLTSMAFVIDAPLNEQFESQRQGKQFNRLTTIVKNKNYLLWSAGLPAGLALSGWAANQPRLMHTSLRSLEAYAFAGLFAYAAKLSFHRHRPEDNHPANAWQWEGPAFKSDYNSFYSGHTTTAFAAAAVFASSYSDKKWVGVLSYSLAGAVGLSRIYTGHHWASDVLMGAATGIAIGRFIAGRHLHGSAATAFQMGWQPHGLGFSYSL